MFSGFFHVKPSISIGFVLLLFLPLLVLSSCEKSEGTGGTGSISGTLIEHFYNDDFSSLIYSRPAVDEEIFIMYGEDNALADRIFTGITGDFSFKYLYPGRYYIYYHTRDSTMVLDEEKEELYLVSLERGEKVDLGNLKKLSTLDYDDGAAMIKGVVRELNYVNESIYPNLVLGNIDFAHEHEVYITYGNHTFYDDRIRTQFDGYFEFSHLIPGNYLIFLYSEDVTGETDEVVLKYYVTITEFDQVVDLGVIDIEKL